MSINRRDFLRGTASAAAVMAGAMDTNPSEGQELPAPSASQIEHIVVVMMENRSFDHFLGWLPGSRGRQAGICYRDSEGEGHPTWQLTTYVSCSHPHLDHSYAGGRSEYDDGKMDGWPRSTTNDVFSIGYYTEEQLPFFSAAARNFTTLDNYFPSILSSTFPNRVFQHAAQTDRLSNTYDISTLPTIWDPLAVGFALHTREHATPRINFGLYDHTSVLKLIEWRYNLPPLTARDASTEIDNLATVLDFVKPDYSVPSLPQVTPPIPTPCGLFELSSEVDNESYDFSVLRNSDLTQGWTLP